MGMDDRHYTSDIDGMAGYRWKGNESRSLNAMSVSAMIDDFMIPSGGRGIYRNRFSSGEY